MIRIEQGSTLAFSDQACFHVVSGRPLYDFNSAAPYIAAWNRDAELDCRPRGFFIVRTEQGMPLHHAALYAGYVAARTGDGVRIEHNKVRLRVDGPDDPAILSLTATQDGDVLHRFNTVVTRDFDEALGVLPPMFSDMRRAGAIALTFLWQYDIASSVRVERGPSPDGFTCRRDEEAV